MIRNIQTELCTVERLLKYHYISLINKIQWKLPTGYQYRRGRLALATISQQYTVPQNQNQEGTIWRFLQNTGSPALLQKKITTKSTHSGVLDWSHWDYCNSNSQWVLIVFNTYLQVNLQIGEKCWILLTFAQPKAPTELFWCRELSRFIYMLVLKRYHLLFITRK